MLCPNCQLQNPDTARFCPQCGQSLEQMRAPSGSMPGDARPASSGSFVGRVIDGKYRIEAPLGKGGMGSVYRARRLLIGDQVALKILQPDWVSDPEMLERFRREAQTAARLKHPNVVTIHDFGRTADGQVYLVMELVEGRNLREVMRGREPLDADFIAEVLEQIGAALDESHRHGIVHRDLKPENILLTEGATDWRVKLLDFGIAHWRDLKPGAATLTQTGAVLGTPRYMSPEQCLGQEIDGRSDVYALGIMLFEMLTGVAPFNSPMPSVLIAQHLYNEPPSLRALNPDIAPAIEQIVLQALSKQREARQPTAGALARQFAAALHRSSPLAAPGLSTASGDTDHSAQTLPHSQPQKSRASSSSSSMAYAVGRLRSRRGRILPDVDETSRAVRATTEGRRRGCGYDLFIVAMLVLIIASVFAWRQLSEEKSSPDKVAVSSPTVEATDESLRLALKLTSADALARADADYKEGRYEEAATFAKAVLAKLPDQPRAEAVLGQSYFMLGQAESIGHLNRALTLGETVTLPIKHHHIEGALRNDASFCSGTLLLKQGTIEFRSDDDGAHSFRIAPLALIELRNESRRSGRIHTRIALGQGSDARAQNYNFYPTPAALRDKIWRTSPACDSLLCQRQAEAVFQLLRQLKP